MDLKSLQDSGLPGVLVKIHIPGPCPECPNQFSGVGLRVCSSYRFPGDTDSGGPVTTL